MERFLVVFSPALSMAWLPNRFWEAKSSFPLQLKVSEMRNRRSAAFNSTRSTCSSALAACVLADRFAFIWPPCPQFSSINRTHFHFNFLQNLNDFCLLQVCTSTRATACSAAASRRRSKSSFTASRLSTATVTTRWLPFTRCRARKDTAPVDGRSARNYSGNWSNSSRKRHEQVGRMESFSVRELLSRKHSRQQQFHFSFHLVLGNQSAGNVDVNFGSASSWLKRSAASAEKESAGDACIKLPLSQQHSQKWKGNHFFSRLLQVLVFSLCDHHQRQNQPNTEIKFSLKLSINLKLSIDFKLGIEF